MHIVDVKNKCKKCDGLPISIERIRLAILYAKEYISLYGKYVADINSYGYSKEDACEKKAVRVFSGLKILQEYYVSLSSGKSSCMCLTDIDLAIQSVLENIPVVCKRVSELDYQDIDRSNEDRWISRNPTCVSYESWERAKYCFIYDYQFAANRIENKVAYMYATISADISCDIRASFASVKNVSCELISAFESKRTPSCLVTFNTVADAESCRKNYAFLVKDVPGCNITYSTYSGLIKCGITHTAIHDLAACGIDMKVKSNMVELYLKDSGEKIDIQGFDVALLEEMCKY